QRLALRHDLALIDALLLGDVTIDAVCCVVDMQVETRLERGTLTVVPREVERCGTQGEQAGVDQRPAVQRVCALQAVLGSGGRAERLLLAGDEGIDQRFYAMVIDGWGWSRWWKKPLWDFERGTHARKSYALCEHSPITGNGRHFSRRSWPLECEANAHNETPL